MPARIRAPVRMLLEFLIFDAVKTSVFYQCITQIVLLNLIFMIKNGMLARLAVRDRVSRRRLTQRLSGETVKIHHCLTKKKAGIIAASSTTGADNDSRPNHRRHH